MTTGSHASQHGPGRFPTIPRQPHIYGAAPQYYRRGQAVASAESPPWWSPELESDALYPYTLAEWTKDIRRWMGATRAAPQRQGPIIALSLGNTARTIIDEVSDEILCNGATLDLGDGLGVVTRSGVDILLAVLRNKSHQMQKP